MPRLRRRDPNVIGRCEARWIVKRTNLDGDHFGIALAAGKQRCSAVGAKRSENSRPRISVCVENAGQSFHGADCVRRKRYRHSRFATRDVLAVSTVTTHPMKVSEFTSYRI